MNGWEAVVAIVGHLAWPLFIFLTAAWLRKSVQSLAERILELGVEHKGTKVRAGFRNELAKAEKEAEALPAPSADTVAEQKALPAARDEPVASIIQTWADLQRELQELAPGESRRWNAVQLLGRLHAEGILSEDARAVAERLRKLRNEVAHGERVDADLAEEFVRLVERVRASVRERARDRKPLPG